MSPYKSYWIVSNIPDVAWKKYLETLFWFYEEHSNSHNVTEVNNLGIKVFLVCAKSQTQSFSFEKKEDSLFIVDGWMSVDTKNFIERHRFLSHSDTLKNSVGEFSSFYIKDSEVYICTDFYGSIPIYYLSIGEHKIVSNDLRSLIAYPGYDVEISDEAVRGFLGVSIAIGENELGSGGTFFKKIKKIPRNIIYHLNDGKIKNLQDNNYFNPIDNTEYGTDLVFNFKRIFHRAINERMSEKKSAILLSGGIDSACVLGSAIENNHQFFNINMSFHSEHLLFSQDQEIVRKASKDLGVETYIIWGDSTLRFQNCEIDNDPLLYIDGPESRSNSLIALAIDSLTSRIGSQQVMTGESGDAILGENMEGAIIDSLIKSGRYRDALNLFKDILKLKSIPINSLSTLSLAYKLIIAPLSKISSNWSYIKNHWSNERIKSPEYILLKEELAHERMVSRQFKNLLHGHRFMMDFLWPKAKYFDALSINSHYSHPFLDSKIIDFAFSVEPHNNIEYKNISGGSYMASKRLARQAFKGILPDFLIGKRNKTSYEAMAKKIFLNSRLALLELFMNDRAEVYQRGLVDKKMFQNYIVSEFLRLDDINGQLTLDYQFLFCVISLEIWLRNICQPKEKLLKRIKPTRVYLNTEVELIV